MVDMYLGNGVIVDKNGELTDVFLNRKKFDFFVNDKSPELFSERKYKYDLISNNFFILLKKAINYVLKQNSFLTINVKDSRTKFTEINEEGYYCYHTYEKYLPTDRIFYFNIYKSKEYLYVTNILKINLNTKELFWYSKINKNFDKNIIIKMLPKKVSYIDIIRKITVDKYVYTDKEAAIKKVRLYLSDIEDILSINNLEYINVKFRKQYIKTSQQGIIPGASYSPKNNTLILCKDFISIDVYHEYAHHIDYCCHRKFGKHFMKYIYNRIKNILQKQFTFQLIHEKFKKGNITKRKMDYLLSDEEIFARLFSEYLFYINGNHCRYSLNNINEGKIYPSVSRFTVEEINMVSNILKLLIDKINKGSYF